MPRHSPPQFQPEGRTELGCVATTGDVGAWDDLLEAGHWPHAVDAFQETPLHIACTYGQLELVKVMLKEQKMDVEAANFEGWTPLCCAIAWGQLDVAKYLLKCGANANTTSASGSSLLHLAAWHGADECVNFLLTHGMAPNQENKHGVTAFDMSGPGQSRRLVYAARMEQEAQSQPVMPGAQGR